MDIIYIGIAVIAFFSAYGLMKICEFPEEKKSGGRQ
jgi:hypothetical protein